jgi:hypothetical protein
VLIVTGVGLLNRRNWARITCIVYSILNGILLIADVLFRLFFELPAQERWRADFLRRHPDMFFLDDGPGGDIYTNQIAAVVIAVLCLAYALTLLIVLLLPHVSAAFAPRRSYYDEDDDDFDTRLRYRRDWEY